MKILIIEDELHNFRMLEHMLSDINPAYEIEGPVCSVEEGRRFLSSHDAPDLIIADIRLGDGLSFDFLGKYCPEVPVIFTTAYSDHALKAFEYNSLSYLLKPVDEEELAAAIEKARRISAKNSSGTFFVVKKLDGEKLICSDDVLYFFSEGKCSFAKMKDMSVEILDRSLDSICQELDPAGFVRANRKYIVPRSSVTETRHLPGGKERLLIGEDDGAEVIVSREKKKHVLKWLEENGK